MERLCATRALAVGSLLALTVASCVSCSKPTATPSTEGIRARVTCPALAYKGQEITVQVEIRNELHDPRLLHSIRIGDDYARGVAIRGCEPAFSRSTHEADGYYSYEFLRNVAGEGRLLIYLDAVAVQTGDLSADLRVCIDTPTNCVGQVIRTVVEDVTPTHTHTATSTSTHTPTSTATTLSLIHI